MGYLDTKLEKAVESCSEMSVGKTEELAQGGYLIYISCEGESYSVNENQRVQYEGYKTIIDNNPNLSVDEILDMVKVHAKTQ